MVYFEEVSNCDFVVPKRFDGIGWDFSADGYLVVVRRCCLTRL